MPFLRLHDLHSGETREFDRPAVRIGRDPESEYPIGGDDAKVVSTHHARVVHDGAAWLVEDAGSRNGTFLDGKRLAPGTRGRLNVGSVIGLGESGPRLKVEALAAPLEATMLEEPRAEATLTEQPRMVRPSAATVRMESLEDVAPPPRPPAPSPPPRPQAPPPRGPAPTPPPPPPPTLRMVFREARTGEAFEGAGGRLRLGRGMECEIRPVGPSDTAVSRVHAEIVLKPDGSVVVRDARSRNGTYVNGKQLSAEHPLKPGDHVLLGEGGPDLIIEQMVVPGAPPSAPGKVAAAGVAPAAEPRGRRSFGGKGATVFFKEMMAETDRKASKRIRWVVWSFVVLLIGATGGLYLWSEARVRQTAATLEAKQAEAQRLADSTRQDAQAEYNRLRVALDSARSSSAPAAVVDSLRSALSEASNRTQALEESLERAQVSLNQQLAAGDSLRRQAQADLQRLRGELSRASGGQVSSALLDSLRRAVQDAEARATSIEGQLRAVKGVDMAALSQANQGSVGLVTGFSGPDEAWNGSGFVITRSGYFVTNRHVAMAEERQGDSVVLRPADSLFVTLADHQWQDRARAIVVSVYPAGGPDLALLKIASYAGSYIPKVDWDGGHVRQGEPAALIGFPQGEGLAYDRETRTFRTSMSAGIFSKVTGDRIQFDGFTVGGSSGSPVFNAAAEVVAVHAAGLKEAAGLGFAVPVKYVLALLPPDAKAELGVR